MKLKPFKRVHGLLAFGVILLVCAVRSQNSAWLEKVEDMTFDARVRMALRFPSTVATNLGFVFINEQSVRRVWDGSLGYRFGLYWPRHIYGRLLDELNAQGARAVALDIIMKELRPDHYPVRVADPTLLPESDEYFAAQARRAGNVILAITPDVTPPSLFVTNAWALGDIAIDKDPDGVLRRVKLFRTYRQWHAAFKQMEDDAEYGVDLHRARIEPRQIVLPRDGADEIKVPLDADGNVDLADFWGDRLPAGMPRRARPFIDERIWDMGVLLAAREMDLDLAHPEIDLSHSRVVLKGRGGRECVIPVDAEGFCYIDWALTENSPRLCRQAIHELLAQERMRHLGTNGLPAPWRDKLVMVGSSAQVGNDLTDRGATPLSPDALLVAKHWNVANSLLTGRFVRRSPLEADLGLIALLGLASALLTWQLRVVPATASVVAMMLAYTIVAFVVYVQTRFWLPLVLPLGGAVLLNYVTLVAWRVIFEQAERRRVRGVLVTIVSPNIAEVLLKAERLALGGARREVSVLFADVRGFTEFTDKSQEQVAEVVRQKRLTGAEAEACYDEQARETLATINQYVGLVADTILQQGGTWDKFIGDCVMAFWGAPNPEPKHAVACVRAAITAQRAIYELNRERSAENRRREAENVARVASGLAPRPLLPILFLGTGINSGMATVGLMGSEVKEVVRQGNYTVFGREVNLASRLESASGRGRIFISQSTFEQLQQHDSALAATCVPLPQPVTLKGFRAPVPVFEVPWRLPGTTLLPEETARPATPPSESPKSEARNPKAESTSAS